MVNRGFISGVERDSARSRCPPLDILNVNVVKQDVSKNISCDYVFALYHTFVMKEQKNHFFKNQNDLCLWHVSLVHRPTTIGVHSNLWVVQCFGSGWLNEL